MVSPWGTDTQSALAGLATDFRNEMGNFQKQMVIYGNAKILEQYQKLMSDLLEQIERQNKAIEQQTEMAALGAGFVKSGNTFIKQSKLVSTAIGMVEAYQWYDGKAALDGYLSSIGAGYGGRIILNEEGNPEEQSRDSVMADLPAFLETADAVEVEAFFGVQKLILEKAFEKIMGTGTAAERKNSKDKKVIGDLAWWIGKPAGSSEFVSQVEQAAPHLGAKEQKKLGMGENVTGLDVLKYLSDPGFGELGSGDNRPSGIVLGFYNKLDLVSRYVDGKDSERMERIQGSVDPISATINQFNPVSILATSIQNVRVASEVYGKDAGYMWEAQALGAFKGMANALGTAVAVATSWSGVGIAVGAAIIAAGNSIQVDTKTGSRDAVMNDRAAVGTAIGIASMYASYIAPPGAGASDRLLAATIRTGANSIGAGFSYNDDGNITGWTLSGSNGDAFWQNMGTGALSAGISEGVIKGFGIQNDYAKDIISSVSSTGVNTFAEYYKYDHGYQNNYAAMANPDIGNASAFWGLAVAMGSRAVSGGSSTDATSGDWSWDNAMQGFGEGFLGEFTGWVGLGSAGMNLYRDLANQTDQAYRVGMSAAGLMRRKEEEAGWVDYYGDDDTLDDRLRSSLSDFDPEYMEQKLAEAMGEPPEGERMGQTPPGMNPQFQAGALGRSDFKDLGITIHKGWTGDVDSLFERMPDNPEIRKNDKNEDKSYNSWNSVRGHKDTYQMIVFQTDENGDEVQMIRIVQKNTTTGGWDETRYVMRNGALVEKSVEARNANGVRLSGSIMGNTKKLDPAKALANEAVVPTRTTLTFRQYNRQTDPTYGGNPQMVSVSNSTSANQFEPQFDVWNAITGEHMGAYSQTTFGGDTRDGRNYSFDPALRRSENLESLLPGFRGHQTVGWNAGRTLYTTNNVVRNVPGHRQNRQTEYQGTPPSTSGLKDWVR